MVKRRCESFPVLFARTAAVQRYNPELFLRVADEKGFSTQIFEAQQAFGNSCLLGIQVYPSKCHGVIFPRHYSKERFGCRRSLRYNGVTTARLGVLGVLGVHVIHSFPSPKYDFVARMNSRCVQLWPRPLKVHIHE